jgi:hypothetical protein
VSHSNDDINILNTTVLQRVVEGLQTIHNGGRFIVCSTEEAGQLELSFHEEPNNNRQAHYNVPVSIFINGDLKFFAQILGRDGMSTSWCMYCKVHPKDWIGLVEAPEEELWSIAQQTQFVESITICGEHQCRSAERG